MKVIQVGLGGFGSVWLENIVSKHPDLEIVGLVDVNQEAFNTAAEKLNLDKDLYFPTMDEALHKLNQVDLVMNITPSKFHREINIAAFAKGIPVFSEKPLAENIQEAVEVIKISNQKKVPFVISQNYRYKPIIHAAKQFIAEGKIGKIENVYIQFFKDPKFGGFREEMEHPLLIDMAIHHFDLIRFLTEEEPLAGDAKSWNPSWSDFKGDSNVHAFFTMTNNIRAIYTGSWSGKGRETSWDGDWNIEGTKGSMLIEGNKIILKHGEGQEEHSYVEPDHSMKHSLDSFIESLRTGELAPTAATDNIKSFRMVTDCLTSIKEKREVHVERPQI